MMFGVTDWKEIALIFLTALIVGMGIDIYAKSHAIESLEGNIATLNAEATLNDIQKEALRKAITDQSEAVEAQRIDAEAKAKELEKSITSIRAKYALIKDELRKLSGDEECQAMRQIINEAVK